MKTIKQRVRKYILGMEDVDHIALDVEGEELDKIVSKIVRIIRQDLLKEIRDDPEVAINKYKLFGS
jgi:hypothetical protein